MHLGGVGNREESFLLFWAGEYLDFAGQKRYILSDFKPGDKLKAKGKIMAKTTPATRQLDDEKIRYELFEYHYDKSAQKIGMQAAEDLGVEAARVFKTLMALVDGQPVCVLVPSDNELSMKKLAHVFGGKSAKMMPPAEAEKATGYVVGGISPLGRRKTSPVAIDAQALEFETIFVNGGGRGLQICIEPGALIDVLRAKVESLVA